MYRECKTLKTVERQNEFKKTLLYMMEHTNYADITISGLCREMNTQRKTFYRYFDGIEDVLDAVIDETVQNAFLSLEGKNSLQGLEEFFQFWSAQRQLLSIFDKNQLFEYLLSRAGERILLMKNFDVTIKELAWISYSCSFLSIVVAWYHGGMRQTQRELAEMVIQMYHFN